MKNQIKKYLRPLYSPIYNWSHNYFFGPKRYKYLNYFILKTNSKNILEIGTWRGDRAVSMIKAAQKCNRKDLVNYYGFDLFEDLDRETFVTEISKIPHDLNYIKHKLEKTEANIYLFKGNTMFTLANKIENLPKMDFIYIDGGHSLETIQNDWNQTSRLMHSKTVVIFDDYWENRTDAGAKKTVDSLNKEKYNIEILPTLDISTSSEFGKLDIRYAKVTLI